MGAQLASKHVIAEMNLTPLIDIVLVVLIIMMVNIPIQVEEMGVKLPSKQEVDVPQDVPLEQLVIAVYEDETLALNRRLMTEEVLFYEVTRRLRPMAEKNVFIDAAPTVPYGRVVDMMDLAREGGASKVGLAKLKEQGPLPPTSVAPGSLPRGVDVGLPSTVGPISEGTADEVIQPMLATINGCYTQALARKPDASGRIMLRIAVGPEGQIMESKVGSSNVDEPGLETCLVQVGQQLRFQPLGEGKTAVVQYPLLFSPG